MSDATVVSTDGTTLAARSSGRGSPLVLVHGAMGDINSFGLIEGPLAEHHTVWVYSRRGRGGSGDGPDYRLDREVDDVLAVLQAAGGDAHLFGHSSGALYAMLAAARAPSLSSLSVYEPPLHVGSVSGELVQAMESALADDDPERAIETFAPTADLAGDELAAVRQQPPVWQALCDGARVFPRELRAMQDEGARLSRPTLPDVPLLYLYGELTRAPVYPSVDHVKKAYPRAEVQQIAGQRHLAPMFEPAVFAQAIIDFTSRVDAG